MTKFFFSLKCKSLAETPVKFLESSVCVRFCYFLICIIAYLFSYFIK